MLVYEYFAEFHRVVNDAGAILDVQKMGAIFFDYFLCWHKESNPGVIRGFGNPIRV